jgi:hypothetical protein
MAKVLMALNNQPIIKMQTTNHKTEGVMPVGSSAGLGVCLFGISLHFFQKPLYHLTSGKIISFVYHTIRRSLKVSACFYPIQIIILTANLIHPPSAKAKNIAADFGALIPNRCLCFVMKLEKHPVIRIPQGGEQNINMRAERSTPLRSLATNAQPVTGGQSDEASKQAAENRLYHFIVPTLVGIIGFLIGNTKTPNDPKLSHGAKTEDSPNTGGAQ